MSQEDRKIAKLIFKNGSVVDVLTRMSRAEIAREVKKGDDPQWIELEGLDLQDDKVEVGVLREMVSAYMIMKQNAGSLVRPPGPGLVQ